MLRWLRVTYATSRIVWRKYYSVSEKWRAVLWDWLQEKFCTQVRILLRIHNEGKYEFSIHVAFNQRFFITLCSDNNKSLHFFCFKKDCIKALNQTWHPDHFTCAKCGEAFGPNQVIPINAIYFDVFLLDTSYLCAIWIPYTFVNISLNIYFKGFHEMESPKNGKPYCRNCYIDLTCSKCAGCKQAITDKAVKALNSDWHVECFICKVGVV